jgi:hypothetical protein
MGLDINSFASIWLVDFEFSAPPGEVPTPICLVAQEFRSGKNIRIWEDKLHELKAPPYPVGEDSLVVAYYAPAEMGCHLALGWSTPARVLDLYAEFKNMTNGKKLPCGAGLLGAMAWFGLDAIDANEKEGLRNLAIRGGPWTDSERKALLDYCESDVIALAKLLPVMLPHIDLPRALFRGRYTAAAARMERAGIPIDVDALSTLEANWEEVKRQLIEEVDAQYQVFENGTFKTERFAKFLATQDIPWPLLPSGHLALDEDTFSMMAKVHPSLGPLHQLRQTLSKIRTLKLEVGTDGRNRCMLSIFGSKTGRNQPSNSKFIFGAPNWLRGLVRPEPGKGLAYLDYCQQEFGIAAALSGDEAMQNAYHSGDPYLAFAKLAGAIPPDGTEATHPAIRDQYKGCALGVQYGIGAESLARQIGQPVHQAQRLLSLHHQSFPKFWAWSDSSIDHAMLLGNLYSVFGWMVHTGVDTNPRMLRNFPMQANGAEILRLACWLATERGITVCAPVHDAILIEASLDELESTILDAQRAMEEASQIVLDGFSLRSDAFVIHHPDRFLEERGREMWDSVWRIIGNLQVPGRV